MICNISYAYIVWRFSQRCMYLNETWYRLDIIANSRIYNFGSYKLDYVHHSYIKPNTNEVCVRVGSNECPISQECYSVKRKSRWRNWTIFVAYLKRLADFSYLSYQTLESIPQFYCHLCWGVWSIRHLLPSHSHLTIHPTTWVDIEHPKLTRLDNFQNIYLLPFLGLFLIIEILSGQICLADFLKF